MILCWFLPPINMNQPWVDLRPLPLEPLPASHSIPPLHPSLYGPLLGPGVTSSGDMNERVPRQISEIRDRDGGKIATNSLKCGDLWLLSWWLMHHP